MPQYDDVPRFDVETIRADFPILDREVNGQPLVYLDSGNTSQKPRQVHRRDAPSTTSSTTPTWPARCTRWAPRRPRRTRAPGPRSPRSSARPAPDEVVFTKNSTEAINLVAYAFSTPRAADDPRFRLGPGDEIVISEMEHHSNIVPWQLLCERTGATLRWFGLTDDGRLDESNLDELVNERTKLVSIVHMSNILGTVNADRPDHRAGPRGRRAGAARRSQSVPHMPVDVVDSTPTSSPSPGTRCCGPTGIGVLWGRDELLDAMPPFLGGGSMIETVDDDRLDVRRRRRPGSRPARRRSPRRSGWARPSTT